MQVEQVRVDLVGRDRREHLLEETGDLVVLLAVERQFNEPYTAGLVVLMITEGQLSERRG